MRKCGAVVGRGFGGGSGIFAGIPGATANSAGSERGASPGNREASVRTIHSSTTPATATTTALDPNTSVRTRDTIRIGSVPSETVDAQWLEVRFLVEPSCSGWRLDRYVHYKIPRLSRTRAQRILKTQAWLNGRTGLRAATRVQEGQWLVLRRAIPPEPDAPRTFGVLFEDDHVLAIDKPAGLAMHATARYHRGTLTWLLREHRPGEHAEIAHRLDRDTSGVVLCGRSPAAAAKLKRAFATRRVEKTYLAIVEGALAGEGVIDHPLALARSSPIRVKMEVRSDGLPARTRWRALRQCGDITLVEATPETGRQHQIRVHLASIGHPVVGDKLYLDESIFVAFAAGALDDAAQARLRLPRHALHAARVALSHPITGAPLCIESPLPQELGALLDDALKTGC